MKWKKLGLVFTPDKNYDWMSSHAANPLAVHMEGDVYRIFFSGRNINNKSSVGAVDVDVVRRQVVQKHARAFFMYGENGSFYTDGVSIGNCYEANGVNYMLFMGWQNPHDSHWRGDIGRLILNQDFTLQLESDVPLLRRSAVDPISLSYPWVMKVEGEGYKMWYGSTVTWDAGNGEMLHVINYATSLDGDNWNLEGLAIPYELGKAQAFSRPTVIGNKSTGFHMWFSFRSGTGETYRIGYAVSQDGRKWELDLDSSGISTSDTGWDSEMIEYPFVFKHKEDNYMLYNGNGYGKTGFGLAILEGYQC